MCCPSVTHAIMESARKLSETCEGLLFRTVVFAQQPSVCATMHTPRPTRKRVQEARPATDARSNLLRLDPAALMQVRLPTGIGEAMAVAACEMSAAQAVQLQDLPSAAAHEEKSFATERAGDAPYRDRLITDNQLMPIPSKRRQLDYAGVHLPSSKLPFFE
jgi:hypothetical protein